jgi:hypothetical protein
VTTAEERLKNRNWRLRNSLWVVGTLAFGCLAWAGFLYVGIVAKRRSWLIASAAYAIGIVASIALMSAAPKLAIGGTDSSSWQSRIATLLLLAVWLGGFVHALLINRTWLRVKAGLGSEPWYAVGGQAAVNGRSESQGGHDPYGMGVDTSQYYAPAPPLPSRTEVEANATLSPRPGEGTSEVPVAGGPSVTASSPARDVPINVNTASLAELLGRLGLDPGSAEKALVERHRMGGFASVDQFVQVTGLPPHVYARVRDILTVSDAAADPGGSTRKASAESGGGGGRVLDL